MCAADGAGAAVSVPAGEDDGVAVDGGGARPRSDGGQARPALPLGALAARVDELHAGLADAAHDEHRVAHGGAGGLIPREEVVNVTSCYSFVKF